MKKISFIVLLLFFGGQLNAQSNWKNFWKQSGPIKTWVLLHPFKAKKALKISNKVKVLSDSIAKTELLDKDKSGGQVDAFRHAYWMASLHQEIGKCAAKSLGKAYERDNYKTFKKNRLEDGIIPDKASKEMDLFNNKVGLRFTKKKKFHPKNGLIFKIVNAIHKGDLKVIKKDKNGSFLTCSGEVINPQELHHRWKNNKCIISSKK